jgi:nitroreductase
METAGRIESWIVDEIRRSGDERRLKLIERSQGKLFYGAPTLLILSADSSDPFGTTNIAALIENLLIAAESLNIGSCWIGMLTALARSQKKEEYAEKLHLPKGFLPYFGVVLGYKAIGEVPMPERRKDIISFLDS